MYLPKPVTNSVCHASHKVSGASTVICIWSRGDRQKLACGALYIYIYIMGYLMGSEVGGGGPMSFNMFPMSFHMFPMSFHVFPMSSRNGFSLNTYQNAYQKLFDCFRFKKFSKKTSGF